jgi:hypothetical protein
MLFLDDQARAVQESKKGMSYAFQAPLRSPEAGLGLPRAASGDQWR